MIERQSNVNPHPNVNSVKAAIQRAFQNLNADEMQSYSKFCKRISKIIKAKRDHIEQLC